jgi:hypothetical protein
VFEEILEHRESTVYQIDAYLHGRHILNTNHELVPQIVTSEVI